MLPGRYFSVRGDASEYGGKTKCEPPSASSGCRARPSPGVSLLCHEAAQDRSRRKGQRRGTSADLPPCACASHGVTNAHACDSLHVASHLKRNCCVSVS